MHEKLSALLDDELGVEDQDQVLTEIIEREELAQTWQRYHMIRAAMRMEPVGHVGTLPQRMAPLLSGNNAPAAARQTRPVRNFGWVPGLAMAASIAGLLAVGLWSGLPGLESGNPAADRQVAEIDEGTRWQTSSPSTESVLNAYLVEHGEFSSPSTMNGLMAYARFVSSD